MKKREEKRRRGPDSEPGERNRSSHAGRRGGAALEENATGRPTRKSTRASSDRTKRTTNLQLKAQRSLLAPSTRKRARG